MISEQIKEKIDNLYDKLVDSLIYDIKTHYPNLTVLIQAIPDHYDDENTSPLLRMMSIDKSKISSKDLEKYKDYNIEDMMWRLGEDEFVENFPHLINDNQFIIKFNNKYGDSFLINQ